MDSRLEVILWVVSFTVVPISPIGVDIMVRELDNSKYFQDQIEDVGHVEKEQTINYKFPFFGHYEITVVTQEDGSHKMFYDNKPLGKLDQVIGYDSSGKENLCQGNAGPAIPIEKCRDNEITPLYENEFEELYLTIDNMLNH